MDSHPRPALARHARLAAAIAFTYAAALALAPAGPTAGDASAARAKPRPVPASEQNAPYPERSTIQVDRDIAYGRFGGPQLDVYRRAAATDLRPAVIVLHGGGWRRGTRERTALLAHALARAGFVAVNVDYTLSTYWRPGYPRQLREVRTAVRFVRRNATRFGIDHRRIGAIGSSAGGHLAALLGTSGRGRGTSGARIGAAVLWSAPLDLVALDFHRLRLLVDQFVGCVSLACVGRRRDASPTTHVTADDPPMLIVNSRFELVPASQARRMAARMRAAGVRHKLWLLPGYAHARAYEDIVFSRSVAFLRRHLR